MRPTRLELEGFASFADRTELDLTDADLFVLSGRTGAGKSSLIDAMIFALYGVVPRYDDRRVVEPAITKGRAEARVRLDFRLGEVTWTAVRVVRRLSNGGATTKEARLERWRDATGTDTVVVADGVDDLNREVEQLLGLTFAHFTTCVVLPQGAFSEFLHAKPKARRDLLVKLLDLGVYGQVGQAARTATKQAEAELGVLRQQLDGDLADATDDALTAARDRVSTLTALQSLVDERQPVMEQLLTDGREQAVREQQLRGQVELLAGVVVPDDVASVGAAVATARTALAEATRAVTAAGERVEAAQEAQAAAGDPTPLRQAAALLARRPEVVGAATAASEAHVTAATARATAATASETAEAAVTQAETHLEHARRADLVGALTSELSIGDPCPVCDTALTNLPDVADDAVAAATARLRDATEQRRAAVTALTEADRRLATAAANQTAAVTAQTRLDEELAALADRGVPVTADEVDHALQARAALDDAVTRARTEETTTRRAATAASTALEREEAAAAGAWRAFDHARDALAGLEPPARVDDDLAASWSALATWAAQELPERRSAAEEAAATVAATRETYREAMQELRTACAEAGVAIADGGTPRDAALQALTRAETHVEQVTTAIARAAGIRERTATATERHQVATMLGTHLASNRFTEWLVSRALRHLVQAATTDLLAMSDGAYSLTLTPGGEFAVIDHRNADEVRPARTLSGGETFLAALALALALSQRVADMAARGAARLEALFLDEGFGTLDADTLSVVADALEELGARGRMVGVITHVPELAARLPVRFDVTKVGAVSAVTRTDASDTNPEVADA